jgi:hypothetical protein
VQGTHNAILCQYDNMQVRRTVTINSGIYFDSDKANFFNGLYYLKVLNRTPENYTKEAIEIANVAAKKLLNMYSIYTLEGRNAKTVATKLLLKKH